MSFQLHCSNQIQICKPFVYFICLCTLLFCVFNGQEVVDINGVHFFVISFISGILWLFCKYHNSNRQRIKNANDKVSWNRNWSQANKHFFIFHIAVYNIREKLKITSIHVSIFFLPEKLIWVKICAWKQMYVFCMMMVVS